MWREPYGDTDGLLHPPPSLLLLQCWKCQWQRRLSESHRRRQKNSGRRHEEESELGKEKAKCQAEREGGTMRSVMVGGRRGTAGGINTLNVNCRHLAAKEREVEREMWDIRGDRVREWVSVTQEDRMMRRKRSMNSLKEEKESWKEGGADEVQIQCNPGESGCLCPYSCLIYFVHECNCLDGAGRVCVVGTNEECGRHRVKTDKSCQFAVLPHNQLTTPPSTKKQYGFHRHTLSDNGCRIPFSFCVLGQVIEKYLMHPEKSFIDNLSVICGR